MPLLELSQVSRSFGGLRAVNTLSLAIEEGEIVGLIGPNGSGKTTVFNLISGVLLPDGGSITFAGQSLLGLKPHEVCHRGIGRTFQLVQSFNSLTALENVRIGVFRTVNDPARATRDALAVLELVGLSHRRDALPASLTIADRKRLELARALATSPRLLLLDEVMAGLRPAETLEMIELARRIHAGGVTLLVIEHVMRAIMSLSHRIVVLHHGEKVAEGTAREVSRDPEVIRAYLGEEYRPA